MLRKLLNTRLLQTRFATVAKSVRPANSNYQPAAYFSDAKEPPQDHENHQNDSSNKDSSSQDLKGKNLMFGQGKKKGGHKGDFTPQILDGKKPKEGQQKPKEAHAQKHKEKTPKQPKQDAPEQSQKKPTVFKFGARRPEEKKAAKSDDQILEDHLGGVSGLREDYQREDNEPQEQDVEDPSLFRKGNREFRGGSGKGGKSGKSMKIFGRKEFDSGFVLSKLGVEIQGETDLAATELTTENKAAIQTRIVSLKQLENNAKKYEALMELYLILDEAHNAQDAYFEAQELGIKKNIVIENMMFEACLKDTVDKAHEFYNYVKSQNRLEEVFSVNMNAYIEAQILNNDHSELDNVLRDLVSINFNLGSLDISVFNAFFKFDKITNRDQYNKTFSARTDFMFIQKAEIFIGYLKEILRRKPSHLDTIMYQFKFPLFFAILNDLQYPKIKLDSDGLDICLNYLEVLAESNLVTPKFVHFEDLARWVAIYFDTPDALKKIYDVLSGIPQNTIFFPYFIEEYNNYVANTGRTPFSAEAVRDLYAFLKEEVDKSKKPLNVEALRVLLETAQTHKQHDIIFDVYENYDHLVKSRESPLFLYIYLTSSFTSLNLTSKNSFQIVNTLISEYNKQHQEFPKSLTTFVKAKALIKDGKYEEAHSIFKDEVFKSIIPNHQRTFLFTLLALVFAPEEADKRRYKDPATDPIINIRRFVNSLSEADLADMYKISHEDTILIYEIGGASNVDKHIAHWQKILDDPTEFNKQQEEIKVRLSAEIEKMAIDKINELRAKYNKKLINDGEPQEHDEEARKYLDPEHSGWKQKRLQVTNLNKADVLTFISQNKLIKRDVTNLLRLPIGTKSRRESSLLSNEREEKYDKPLLDLVNDLMLWGIYNNEPLALRLGEEFYETIGHKMSSYFMEQIQQYYKYQLTGKLDRTENSFSYTQEAIRNIPKTFFDANSPYTVVYDDPTYDRYVSGLAYNKETRPLHEQLIRKNTPIKKYLFKDQESKDVKGGKINLIN